MSSSFKLAALLATVAFGLLTSESRAHDRFDPSRAVRPATQINRLARAELKRMNVAFVVPQKQTIVLGNKQITFPSGGNFQTKPFPNGNTGFNGGGSFTVNPLHQAVRRELQAIDDSSVQLLIALNSRRISERSYERFVDDLKFHVKALRELARKSSSRGLSDLASDLRELTDDLEDAYDFDSDHDHDHNHRNF